MICNATLTPVEKVIYEILAFDANGKGKVFDYLDFFEDHKIPGCVISCKLVDDKESSNQIKAALINQHKQKMSL